MKSAVRPPLEPMEAQTAAELPLGEQWQYEPKWDGFRCLIFRNGSEVYLQSKSKPLARYFPEVVSRINALSAKNFVLDGELVIPTDGTLSFDNLLMRLHPAESRVKKLSVEIPATFIAFDMLESENGVSLLDDPLHSRREKLEAFVATHFDDGLLLSPATRDASIAREWFRSTGGGLDGIMAKLVDAPYTPGERIAMRKFKHMRTAECVVGGFRYGSGKQSKIVASLLLGLYDADGLLHHVGYTSAMNAEMRRKLTPQLEAIVGDPGFTGRAPGGPSRWSTKRSSEWQPLETALVVEIEYDHFSGDRFRHGTSLLRWRPDKPPEACTLDQVLSTKGSALQLIPKGA